jgi:hypothetical protein
MSNGAITIAEAGFWRRVAALAVDALITIPLIGMLRALDHVWLEMALSLLLFSAYVVGFFISQWEATPA